MDRRRTARTIFGDRQGLLRPQRVKRVEMRPEIARYPEIPAEVAVRAAEIRRNRRGRDRDALVEQAAFTAGGERGRAARVGGVRHVLQGAQQRQRIGRLACGIAGQEGREGIAEIDFIGDSPGDNRGMIAILRDQFAQLLTRIVGQRGARLELAAPRPGGDQRNFIPHQQAIAVGEIVDRLAMLIMRQADRVDAHLAHDRHVGGDIGRVDRPALAFAVLMIADAAQLDMLVVEEQALVWIDADRADAEWLAHAIDHAAARIEHIDRERVEIGVGHALPAMRVRYVERERGVLRRGGRQFERRLCRGDSATLGVDQAHRDTGGVRAMTGVSDARAHIDSRGGGTGIGGGRQHARATEIGEIDMHRIDRDQPHRAIQPAMHKEIAGQRQDIGGGDILARRRAVIGPHDEEVVAAFQQSLGRIHPEAREAAGMIAEFLAVQPHAGDPAGRIEFEPDALAAERRGHGEPLAIPAKPLRLVDSFGAMDVALRVGAVEANAVPCVRDADRLPSRIVESARSHIRGRIALMKAPPSRQRLHRPPGGAISHSGGGSGRSGLRISRGHEARH